MPDCQRGGGRGQQCGLELAWDAKRIAFRPGSRRHCGLTHLLVLWLLVLLQCRTSTRWCELRWVATVRIMHFVRTELRLCHVSETCTCRADEFWLMLPVMMSGLRASPSPLAPSTHYAAAALYGTGPGVLSGQAVRHAGGRAHLVRRDAPGLPRHQPHLDELLRGRMRAGAYGVESTWELGTHLCTAHCAPLRLHPKWQCSHRNAGMELCCSRAVPPMSLGRRREGQEG